MGEASRDREAVMLRPCCRMHDRRGGQSHGTWARPPTETLAMMDECGTRRIWARVDTPQLAQFTRRAGFTEIDSTLPGYRIFERKNPCHQQ